MTPREAQREKDLEALRRAGLCTSCADTAPEPGSDLCRSCRTGQRDEAEYHDDRRRSEW